LWSKHAYQIAKPLCFLDCSELAVQALNRLAEIVTSYMVTQTFVAAVKLGVFEALANGSATAEEIASRVKIHPQGCRRLLSALRQLGLVESEDGRYCNSSVGTYCCSRASVNLGAIIGFTEPFYHMFEYLPDALREYSPRWQQALGTSQADVFGALYEDPVRQFAAFMQSLSVPQGQVIADHFDFAPYHCILDVAGGPGGQAIEIGRKHPHLRGIVMDMPPVCEIAAENIAAAGLSSRFKAFRATYSRAAFPKAPMLCCSATFCTIGAMRVAIKSSRTPRRRCRREAPCSSANRCSRRIIPPAGGR
jgi:DNA-binding IscR family transcriptional regulator